MPTPTVFLSYSHKDEIRKDRLVAHLSGLEREGLLQTWDDRKIRAGADEIGDRRGEDNASWNLGEEMEKAGDLSRAGELMQNMVDFQREIGHSDAESNAARVEEIRARISPVKDDVT